MYCFVSLAALIILIRAQRKRAAHATAALRLWWKKLQVMLKICIAAAQIIVSFPDLFVLKYSYPSAPLKLTDFMFSVFNFQVLTGVPLGCVGSWTFFDKLVFVTITPAAVLVLGFACIRIARGAPTGSRRAPKPRASKVDVAMQAVAEQLGLTAAVSKALLWCVR